MFKAHPRYIGQHRAGENTQASLECTTSSNSLFLATSLRSMSYFCSPNHEWEITAEKFCDLSKLWGRRGGHIQLRSPSVVFHSPVSCHPLPQALKASINSAPQRVVHQWSLERRRLSQTNLTTVLPLRSRRAASLEMKSHCYRETCGSALHL